MGSTQLSVFIIIISMAQSLLSVQFEVFGKVQGVFFRKFTQKQAIALGLTGWVKNTRVGTVVGTIEGQVDKVGEMKIRLEKIGPPKSRIDSVDFSEEKKIDSLNFDLFKIIK